MRTETFQTPGLVALDIRLGAGEIRLETGETTETTVELEPLRSNEASASAVQEARVELRERPDGVDIVVDVRDRSRFSRGAEVLVHVNCPAGSSLHARTGSADVEGRGRFGEIEVETGSGDVAFQEVAGDTKVNAASGDVQISTVGGTARFNTASGDIQVATIGGDAKVNSASGDIQLGEVGGRLEANSASGDVEVREARSGVSVNSASGDQMIGSVIGGSVSLKSASGDLRVGIKQGSKLFVDAKSRSGEVSSELEVSDVAPEGEAPLVELRASTMSGDIHIVRA
jgi:DUF4097 and DUF4098 domain-containing protein YvlB